MTKKLTSSQGKAGKVRRPGGGRVRIPRGSASGKVLSQEASPSQWKLHEAKARFPELIRRAKTQGPQHVTVYGREEVVVISADDFSRLKGEITGQALVDVMRTSPLSDIDIEPQRMPMPVRDIVL